MLSEYMLIAKALSIQKSLELSISDAEQMLISDSDIKLFQADENETPTSQECRRRVFSQELLRLFPETERRRQPP